MRLVKPSCKRKNKSLKDRSTRSNFLLRLDRCNSDQFCEWRALFVRTAHLYNEFQLSTLLGRTFARFKSIPLQNAPRSSFLFRRKQIAETDAFFTLIKMIFVELRIFSLPFEMYFKMYFKNYWIFQTR
jgi:hypothetical protein